MSDATSQAVTVQSGNLYLEGQINLHEYQFGFWVGGVTLTSDIDAQKDDRLTISLADGRSAEGKVIERQSGNKIVLAATTSLRAP